MADYELKRNGSGYYDETAFKTFMGMAKAGDIWTANDGKEQVLILKNQGEFCNVLMLTYTHKHSRQMEITSAGTYYTDPAMIRYLFHGRLGTFVQRLPASEFEKVMKAVEDALGFGKQAAPVDRRKEAHDLLDMILDKVGGL